MNRAVFKFAVRAHHMRPDRMSIAGISGLLALARGTDVRWRLCKAPHLRVREALVLVAPDHKVQPARQVALLYQVLGALRVRHAVLVQHEHVEPVAWRTVVHPARACSAGVRMRSRVLEQLCIIMSNNTCGLL